MNLSNIWFYTLSDDQKMLKTKKKDTNIIFENAYVCLYDAFWLAYILAYLQGPYLLLAQYW